jgi:hypothetical protein
VILYYPKSIRLHLLFFPLHVQRYLHQLYRPLILLLHHLKDRL